MSINPDGKKEPTIEEVRRLSNGCMLFFFLPVLLLGLGLIGWGFAGGPYAADATEFYFWGVIVSAVGGVPLGAYLLNRESFLVGIQLRRAHPNQPWMWREDWRTGVVRARGKRQLVSPWLGALIVTGVIATVISNVWEMVPYYLEAYPWQTQLALAGLCLIPLSLLGNALYVTLRQQRFGGTTLHLKKTPLQPGEPLTGRLETTLAEVPQEGVAFKLSCIGYVRRGKSSREVTLWSGTSVTDSMRILPGPSGITVPVEIAIPATAKTAGKGGSSAHRQWRLSASARIPGIDFLAEFEVPVFRVGAGGEAVENDPD